MESRKDQDSMGRKTTWNPIGPIVKLNDEDSDR